MKLLIKISALSFICLALFVVVVTAGIDPAVVTTPREAFINGAFVVKGEGVVPSSKSYSKGKKRLMAIRSAKVSALRELAEILNTVKVRGGVTLSEASTKSPQIALQVEGLVRGASVIKEVYNSATETGTVFISLDVTGKEGLLAGLTNTIIGTTAERQGFSSDLIVSNTLKENSISDDTIDGLVIDTTGFKFSPAIVNRIIIEDGSVIYGPSKVAQAVLVEKGSAEYTTTVGKARAVLKLEGSANPLIIKPVSVKEGTDVVLSIDDAEKISLYNHKANFLESANVVFVLE